MTLQVQFWAYVDLMLHAATPLLSLRLRTAEARQMPQQGADSNSLLAHGEQCSKGREPCSDT